MSTLKPTLALTLLLTALPSRALGLATEHHGNDPVGPGWAFPAEVVSVANLPSRVYWREINGDPQFFFKGNTEALNRALETFAKIRGEKDIYFCPVRATFGRWASAGRFLAIGTCTHPAASTPPSPTTKKGPRFSANSLV